ncbi:enolase-phosphatase E1-like [Daphnia carinata]|uniref:enolase-phosphatase E1-like n=1 Tax=Daphnia carinata TaxID=120202 RepID=UPI002869207E|nr:enolase-phosphatase E1-like [Daphnia carinata]XP_059350738.1 enolase-phosphatase E1-like [Daphnia carinata]XP_059350739.1 enolase-phosphatase E1-like [Daphnia carinata]
MEPRMYKSGDVVWVLASKRLGWWPGRVENVEELRQELVGDVTDKTIAVVKFLNEDNYQFVEDETIICAYESNRKQEYISLGMKKYFEKKRLNETSSPFMKFADSIRQAEKLIGGNPNMVDDEKFQPKKAVPAQSKYKNIFVDPRVKEAKTKSPVKGTTPRRPGRPTAKEAITPKVNHPRFQGQSDHEVRIRRQEKSPLAGSPGVGEYKCDSCTFQTSRLNLMVLHKKSEHLSNSSSSNTITTKQKTAQKRQSSPTKKPASKRSKIIAEPDGDLFDQVKRNLESKEIDSKPSQSRTSAKTQASPKTAKMPKTAKTPKTPRTPRSGKASATATSAKSPITKPSESKTQFNPKKKWLKSLQKEANPEVKNKLMADWDEDDEEEKQQQNNQTGIPLHPEKAKEIEAESDSDSELRPSKSDLLHQRSDDEDEDDAMETEPLNIKTPDKFNEGDAEASNTEESLIAGISAEIDKLNADLDATHREARSLTLNGDSNSTDKLSPKKETITTSVNGVAQSSPDTPSKGEEEIKQDVASLLAETSVPTIPDITELSKAIEIDKSKTSTTPSEIEELKEDIDQGVANNEPEKVELEQPMDEEEINQVVENEAKDANPHPSLAEEKMDQSVEGEMEKANPEQIVEEKETCQLEKSIVKPIENVEAPVDVRDTNKKMEEEQNVEIDHETLAVEKEETATLPEAGNESDLKNGVETTGEDRFETVVEESVETVPEDRVETVAEDRIETVAQERIENVPEGRVETVPEERIETAEEKTVEVIAENRIEAVAENGVIIVTEDAAEAEAVALTSQNGEATEVVTTNGGSNLLMQGEDGETYMVVWDPGTNIQEFLACGGEGEDGSAGTTQTLLIDPSSLQAGSDLENLFQMAVAASAAPQQQNEQSNSTMPSSPKGGRRSSKSTPKGTPIKGCKPKIKPIEELLNKHGDAVGKELAENTVVWSVSNSTLFLPGAVIESSNVDTLTLLAFDVERPDNQRKYRRNRVISAFHHQLNLELLAFGRTKNKAAVCKKLDLAFEHASNFVGLRSKTNFNELTARQYITACHRSPVKLFSERYLTSSPLDEIRGLPEPLDDSDSSEEVVLDTSESGRGRQIVDIMLEEHVLTDSCLQHLAGCVTAPSQEQAFRVNLYNSQSWQRLTQSATTSGILGNSRELYSKLADFLTENVHRVQELQEGKDRKRAFILDLLLPEALIYGVQKTFHVTYQEAKNIVVYGIKDHDKYHDIAT